MTGSVEAASLTSKCLRTLARRQIKRSNKTFSNRYDVIWQLPSDKCLFKRNPLMLSYVMLFLEACL